METQHTYKAYQSLKAGVNSSYGIKRSDGEYTGFVFDTIGEAKIYIEDRLKKGQDPMTTTINEEEMIKYLLNN